MNTPMMTDDEMLSVLKSFGYDQNTITQEMNRRDIYSLHCAGFDTWSTRLYPKRTERPKRVARGAEEYVSALQRLTARMRVWN